MVFHLSRVTLTGTKALRDSSLESFSLLALQVPSSLPQVGAHCVQQPVPGSLGVLAAAILTFLFSFQPLAADTAWPRKCALPRQGHVACDFP